MNGEKQQTFEANEGSKKPESASQENQCAFQEFAKMLADMGITAASTATKTGQVVADTAVEVGTTIGYSASQTGKAVMDTATSAGEEAAKQTVDFIEQGTQKAGEAIASVSDNWLVRNVSGFFKLDWIFAGADQVDLQKADEAVKKLQQEYPQETPWQIAHRIIVEKATYAGGVGLVSSILPGAALALLAVDLAATTRLQSEMIFQIAAAYGLDLKDPARKGEVLTIFGLAMGGSRVVRVGLGTLRVVPIAGAAIGAGANAAIFYSLGLAACQYYETKLNSPNTKLQSKA